ncbi:MAG: dihydropteroate synthase [Burkholderiaceae bacterium]|nr:dihydropteroate synthase [Burkholderiaceae bacterium]
MFWQTSRFRIDLSRPQVMGIVNVTPDSFSDGGRHIDPRAALRHCEQLVGEGADILDIGGESTRPGAAPVSPAEELARIEPVIRGALTLGVPVSVDTFKPEVMQRVLDWGVDVINDVRALQEAGSALVVARHGSCGVCLMHMHRDPQSMQLAPMEGDAVSVVRAFLAQAAARLQVLGVEHTRIVLDPGIGFGKTVAQNCALLARQRALADLGFPLLVGWSRKSTLGAITAVDGVATPPAERLLPSVAAALLAVERGAAVVRVHDVRETVQALRVWQACSGHPT